MATATLENLSFGFTDFTATFYSSLVIYAIGRMRMRILKQNWASFYTVVTEHDMKLKIIPQSISSLL